jgi:hypothetical protein
MGVGSKSTEAFTFVPPLCPEDLGVEGRGLSVPEGKAPLLLVERQSRSVDHRCGLSHQDHILGGRR